MLNHWPVLNAKQSGFVSLFIGVKVFKQMSKKLIYGTVQQIIHFGKWGAL